MIKSSIVTFCLSAVCLSSWANNTLLDNQQQLQQFQRQQQNRWLELHQFQAPPSENTPIEENLSDVCLPYQRLRIVGATLIDPTPLLPLPYECLNENRLNQLSRDLTQAYLEAGYVYNPFQFEDDGSGVLTLRVTEGKVTKLIGDSAKVNLSMLFPGILGSPLNIKVLDQGLDQANRLSSNDVSVDVLPAKNGEITLMFVNAPSSVISGALTLDNYTNAYYHRWQSRIDLSIDSPFGLSDNLYLGVSHTLKSFKTFNRSAMLYYSLPYGRWTFSSFGAFSQFRQQFPLIYHTAEQKGKTWQAGIRADYMFHRGSNHISTISAQIERLNSQNYFNDSELVLQSPKLSIAQLSFNHLQLFSQGSLIFNLDYRYGLSRLNTGENQAPHQPEGYFRKWNADLQFAYLHWLGSAGIRQSHRLLAQYSQDSLPAIEQMELLGRYAVRGFQDLSLSAEKSVLLQNTLSWITQLGTLHIEPYIGVDFGIQKNATENTSSRRAFSYLAGLKIAQPRWKMDLQWAKGKMQAYKGYPWETEYNVNFTFSLLW